MSAKRWELPKRFFKYSESLLALPSTDATGRAKCLLKALRELFKQEELHYLIDDVPLNGSQAAPEGEPSASFVVADRSHRLYAPHAGLKGNQKKYFQLVLELYQKTFPLAEAKAAASLRNYRKQREVILTLAQRQQKSKPGNRPNPAEPGLEEEVIQYQTQLLSELQEEKNKNKALARQLEDSQAFWLRFAQHAQTRLWIQQGWLGLQPKPSRQALSQEFQPQQLVREQAQDLSRLLAALLNLQRPLGPRPTHSVSLAAACHKAMADLAEQGRAAALNFELAPNLAKAEARLDFAGLVETLYFLLEALSLMQESAPNPLTVKVSAATRQLEFRCALPKEAQPPQLIPATLEECLQQPQGQDLALYLASALAQSLGADLHFKRQGAGWVFVLHWS